MIQAHNYKSNNFIIDRNTYKTELKPVNNIDEVGKFLGIKNLSNNNDLSIKVANVINIVTIVGRNDSDSYFGSNNNTRPTKEQLIDFVAYTCTMSRENAVKLIDLCLHTSDYQKNSRIINLFNVDLRTGSASKLYNIIKNNVPQNLKTNIISHKIINKFFNGLPTGGQQKNDIENLLKQLHISDKFTKLQSTFRMYKGKKEYKEMLSSASHPKLKELIFNGSVDNNNDIETNPLYNKLSPNHKEQIKQDLVSFNESQLEIINLLHGMIKNKEFDGWDDCFNTLTQKNKDIILQARQVNNITKLQSTFRMYKGKKEYKEMLSSASYPKLKELIFNGSVDNNNDIETNPLYNKLSPNHKEQIKQDLVSFNESQLEIINLLHGMIKNKEFDGWDDCFNALTQKNKDIILQAIEGLGNNNLIQNLHANGFMLLNEESNIHFNNQIQDAVKDNRIETLDLLISNAYVQGWPENYAQVIRDYNKTTSDLKQQYPVLEFKQINNSKFIIHKTTENKNGLIIVMNNYVYPIDITETEAYLKELKEIDDVNNEALGAGVGYDTQKYEVKGISEKELELFIKVGFHEAIDVNVTFNHNNQFIQKLLSAHETYSYQSKFEGVPDKDGFDAMSMEKDNEEDKVINLNNNSENGIWKSGLGPMLAQTMIKRAQIHKNFNCGFLNPFNNQELKSK